MAQKFILTAQLKLAAPTNVAAIVNQINRGLRGVSVNVHINTSNVNSQLNNINRSLNSTQKSAKAATNEMERFGEQAALAIRRYGAFTLATTAFIKLTNSIQAGVDDAIKFDREMVRIAQVTGHTIGGLKGLNDEVTKLAKNYGVASSEILEAGVTLAQAGQSAKQVKIILESIAKTGVSATFGNMKNTTEAVIAAMQQFNLKAEDMEETLSSINAVSAKFAVEASDITTAIIRTGGAFEAAGGNIKEFQALFTSVRQTTRESAETIATGFRTIFTRLQRSRTQNFLQSLGIDLKDAQGQFAGPYEAIRRLSTALKDLQSTDPRFAQIIEELGGFRQISKVIPLITKFDVAQQALNVSLRSGSSLTEDAEVAQQSLAVQISKVREEFLALIRSVSNSSAFRGFLDLTLKLSSALIKLADSLQPIIPLIAIAGVAKIGPQVSSFTKGFSNKIGHSQGGTIRGFATGGLVPGQGDGDTVPARLTPGEFVVRKNAVKAIGVENLHRLNKYAFGGIVKLDSQVGTKTLGIKDDGRVIPATTKDVQNILGINLKGNALKDALGQYTTLNPEQSARYNKFIAVNSPDDFALIGAAKAKRFGPSNTNTPGRVDLGKVISIVTPDSKFIGQSQAIEINGTLAQIGKATSSTKEGSDKVIAAFAAEHFGSSSAANISKAEKTPIHAQTTAFGLKKGLGDSFNKNAGEGIVRAINDVISNNEELQTITNIPPKTLVNLRDVVSKSAQNAVKGILFEGVIRQAIGAKIPNGADAVIDFNNTTGFEKIFQDGQNIGDKAEAKATLNLKNARSTVLKTLKEKYGVVPAPKAKKSDVDPRQMEMFALGGQARGSDTVPAMLTPGEFVINKASASKLGLSALNRLNQADKVGHYAQGGSVKGYAGGGAVNTAVGALQNPLVFGLLISSLETVVKQLGLADTALGGMTKAISGVGLQFTILNTVVSTTKDGLQRFGIHKLPGNETRSQAQIAESLIPDYLADRQKSLKKNYIAAGLTPKRAQRAVDQNLSLLTRQATKQANIDATATYNSGSSRFARGAGIAGVVGGAVTSYAGDYFSESGNKKISEGNASGVNESAAGGALSGAGQGAAAGAIFGPWGIAIGAAVGGIYGFTTALKKANDDLDKVRFVKKMEEFTTLLDSVTSGRISLGDAKSSIIDTTHDITTKYINSTGDNKKDIRASFNTESSKIEQMIGTLAKSAGSFEELEKSTGHLISDFSLLTNIPYAQLRDQLVKQIQAEQKVVKFNKSLEKFHDTELRTTLGLIAMSEAVQKAAASFQRFDAGLSNAAHFIEGGLGSSHTKDASGVLDKASHGKISDTTEIDAIAKGFTSTFGDIGKEQADKLSENTKLLAALPSLLLEAKSGTGFSSEEGKFEQVLTGLLNKNGFKNSITGVVGGVRNVIGAEGKDEKIIDDIRNNLDGVTAEVGKSLQTTISAFKEFAPAFKEQGDRLKTAFDIYTSAQLKVADAELAILHRSQNFANIVAGATGKLRGTGAVRADELARAGSLTGGVTDVNTLGKTLADAQRDSNKYGQEAGATTDVTKQKEALEKQSQANIVIGKTTKALHLLADTSESLAEVQKELAQIEDHRKFKEGIADVAIFGSRQDRLQQSRTIGATAHAIRFGIDNVHENDRGNVLNFLKALGKNQFLGVSGEEHLARLRENSGFGKAIGQAKARELSLPGESPEAHAALNQAHALTEAANGASKILADNVRNTGDAVKDAIAHQNQEFLNKLETIFKDKLVSDKDNDIKSLSSKQDDALKKINLGTDLRKFGIVKTNNKDNTQSAKGAIDLVRKIQNLGKLRGGILNAKSFQSTVNAQTPQNELLTSAYAYANKNNITIHNKEAFEKDFRDAGAQGRDASQSHALQRLALSKSLERAQALTATGHQVEQEKLTKQLYNDYGDNDLGKKIYRHATDATNTGGYDAGEKALKAVESDLGRLDETIEQSMKTFNELNEFINKLISEKNAIQASKPTALPATQPPVTRAGGGSIPGIGNTDTVPAMLTPGEFVMKKSAVQSIGLENLYAMNNGYSDGGRGSVSKAEEARYRRHAERMLKDKARKAELEKSLKETAARPILTDTERLSAVVQNHTSDAKADRRRAIGEANLINWEHKVAVERNLRETTAAERAAARQTLLDKNVKNLGGLGDTKELVAQKKALYEKGMAIGTVRPGLTKNASGSYSRLTRGSFLEDEERMERAKELQKKYGHTAGIEARKQETIDIRRRIAKNAEAAKDARAARLLKFEEAKKGQSIPVGDAKSILDKLPSKPTQAKTPKLSKAQTELNRRLAELDKSKEAALHVPTATNAKDHGLIHLKNGKYVLDTPGNRKQYPPSKRLNFNKGGVVQHYNGGGHVSGGASIHGVEELNRVVEKFSTVVHGLAEKMSQFKDMSISLQATHKVEVTFNGAEVLARMQPEIQKMAIEESKKAINNMLDSKFPDVGRMS